MPTAVTVPVQGSTMAHSRSKTPNKRPKTRVFRHGGEPPKSHTAKHVTSPDLESTGQKQNKQQQSSRHRGYHDSASDDDDDGLMEETPHSEEDQESPRPTRKRPGSPSLQTDDVSHPPTRVSRAATTGPYLQTDEVSHAPTHVTDPTEQPSRPPTNPPSLGHSTNPGTSGIPISTVVHGDMGSLGNWSSISEDDKMGFFQKKHGKKKLQSSTKSRFQSFLGLYHKYSFSKIEVHHL